MTDIFDFERFLISSDSNIVEFKLPSPIKGRFSLYRYFIPNIYKTQFCLLEITGTNSETKISEQVGRIIDQKGDKYVAIIDDFGESWKTINSTDNNFYFENYIDTILLRLVNCNKIGVPINQKWYIEIRETQTPSNIGKTILTGLLEGTQSHIKALTGDQR